MSGGACHSPPSPDVDRAGQRNRHRVGRPGRHQSHRVRPKPVHATGLPAVFVVTVTEAAVLPAAPAEHLLSMGGGTNNAHSRTRGLLVLLLLSSPSLFLWSSICFSPVSFYSYLWSTNTAWPSLGRRTINMWPKTKRSPLRLCVHRSVRDSPPRQASMH